MKLNEETLRAREALREKHKKYLYANEEKLAAIEYRRIHGVPERKVKEVPVQIIHVEEVIVEAEAIPVVKK